MKIIHLNLVFRLRREDGLKNQTYVCGPATFRYTFLITPTILVGQMRKMVTDELPERWQDT